MALEFQHWGNLVSLFMVTYLNLSSADLQLFGLTTNKLTWSWKRKEKLSRRLFQSAEKLMFLQDGYVDKIRANRYYWNASLLGHTLAGIRVARKSGYVHQTCAVTMALHYKEMDSDRRSRTYAEYLAWLQYLIKPAITQEELDIREQAYELLLENGWPNLPKPYDLTNPKKTLVGLGRLEEEQDTDTEETDTEHTDKEDTDKEDPETEDPDDVRMVYV